jgi:hypothetical protein
MERSPRCNSRRGNRPFYATQLAATEEDFEYGNTIDNVFCCVSVQHSETNLTHSLSQCIWQLYIHTSHSRRRESFRGLVDSCNTSTYNIRLRPVIRADAQCSNQ